MTIRIAPWDAEPRFAKWRTDVQVAVEADDFATQVLWGQWAKGGTQFWRRVEGGAFPNPIIEPADGPTRVTWEQGRSKMAQAGKPLSGVGGKGVLTCVSLTVDKLDGVPVLFYWATSILVDHAAVRDFIQETFVNARRRLHDANNFHNAIFDIRAISKRR